jgi:hypothetical protein
MALYRAKSPGRVVESSCILSTAESRIDSRVCCGFRFFSPIWSVGDKSFSVTLDLAWCRFGMLTVLWAHNMHGCEVCWGRQGEAVARCHRHGQPVKRHGGQAWQ